MNLPSYLFVALLGHDNHGSSDKKPSTVKLRTYTGEEIGVLGCISVNVHSNEQEAQLPLLVVKGKGPSLLGSNWLTKLRLNWQEIFSVRMNHSLESLLKQHEGCSEMSWVHSKG